VISGTFPGAEFAQLGCLVWSGAFVFAGGLLGALVHGFIYEKVIQPCDDKMVPDVATLDAKLGVDYWVAALPLAAAFGGLVYYLEIVAPWRQDFPGGMALPSSSSSILKEIQSGGRGLWAPYVCGVILGLLQLPLRTVVHTTLGSSISYSTVCGFLVKPIFGDKTPAPLRDAMDKRVLWQMAYSCIGISAGAFLCAFLSGLLNKTQGFSMQFSAVGGFLLILGARWCRGCIVNHGISGIAELNFASFVVTASMVGGGMGAISLMTMTGFQPSA